MKLFLIGMMGSGKTYWAEKLKKKCKVPAYDLDNLVEIMEERTIEEMFDQDGEAFFRKEESKMLRLFKEKKQFILSCGGGTPCFYDNMQWMNKNGITVWIDEPIAQLATRLEKEKEKRPAIRALNNDELVTFLQNKLEERMPFYSLATYRLGGTLLNEASLINIVNSHA